MVKQLLKFGVTSFAIVMLSGATSSPVRVNLPLYDKVLELLQNNPTTGKPTQTLEEWLPLLPLELRSNFTFVYQSRSPHGDLGEKAVDALHPRIILFSNDGKMTLAFNGNPEKPGYQTVEMIQYLDHDARFEFSKHFFPEARKSASKEALLEEGKPNPASCLKCHGADPRPISDSYPLWPGFYGSVRDTFPKNSPELPWYKKFLKEESHKGPYQFLNWPEGTSVPPYLDPKDYNSQSKEGAIAKLKYLPNTRLGMAWTELNRKRIQRKLEASPFYKSFRYPLVAGLLGCQTLPVSQNQTEKAYRDLYYENANRLQRLGVTPEGPDRKTLDMMELSLYENMTQIDYLAKVLKVDRSDWSLAFENPSLSFFDGILSSYYKDKNYYLKEDFILEMFRQIASESEEFKPYFQTYKAYEQEGYPFGERLDFEGALGACEKLLKKTEEILPEIDEISIPSPSPMSVEEILQIANLKEIPFARCTHCHEGVLSLVTGRAIPFGSPRELKKVLSSKSRTGRLLFDEILTRVNSHGLDQMPPHGDALKKEEIENLQAYLKAVIHQL